ncbi:Leucine Rich repeats (2 copies) [Novymonas esmeraldas]|uniref:Leucine Rich repeats (2 copies) n=1 Tax=Novymonas esmeraldas TaxID=1808958 RepID=A0AAW0EWL0_9TRYP
MSTFKAENTIRDSLDAAELSLSAMHLSSLSALLPLLAHMPRLRRLDVSHNALRELPADLSALTQLESLDITHNPVGSVQHVLEGLRSLPRLTSLSITLPAPAEEAEAHLIVSLPRLLRFNGSTLVEEEEGVADEAVATVATVATAATPADSAFWTAADSAGIEGLFADVSRQDASSTHEFVDYMGRVVQHVTCLTAAEDDVFAQEGEVLKARRLLYEYCVGDVIRGAFKDGHDAIGRRLQALLRYESAMMDQCDAHWRRILRDRDDRLAHMRHDMQDAMADIRSLMDHLPPCDTAAAAPVAQARVNAQRSSTGGGGAGGATTMSLAATPLARTQHSTRMDTSDVGGSAGASPQPLPPAGVTRRSQRRQSFAKSLTLRQLKEIIEEIYASKAKYDDKCKRNQLPRETMEQHMYSYLNQRYGLRDIILEWATAIVQAVRRYAPEDNDVAVFGKILRNEVDEDFRFVQQHVRETVKELLRLHLKARRPLAGVAELNSALQCAMSGTVAEDAWKEVVKYMYNAGDAALITSIIHQYLYRQSLPTLQRHRRGEAEAEEVKLSPTAVYSQLLYRDFVRLLLDFQLDGHERFLERYVGLFRRHDVDQDGIVNGAAFASIVRELDPSKSAEAVEAMVARIDPHGNELISFSESITFLNDELLKLSYSQHESPE